MIGIDNGVSRSIYIVNSYENISFRPSPKQYTTDLQVLVG